MLVEYQKSTKKKGSGGFLDVSKIQKRTFRNNITKQKRQPGSNKNITNKYISPKTPVTTKSPSTLGGTVPPLFASPQQTQRPSAKSAQKALKEPTTDTTSHSWSWQRRSAVGPEVVQVDWLWGDRSVRCMEHRAGWDIFCKSAIFISWRMIDVLKVMNGNKELVQQWRSWDVKAVILRVRPVKWFTILPTLRGVTIL